MNRFTVIYVSMITVCIIFVSCLYANEARAAQSSYTPTMGDYCVTPPFLSSYVPPQVLFTLGKDHKFFYPAYNDASDIDGNGQLDVGYKHAIVYKGYFDPNKCYNYTTLTGKEVFEPISITATRYCDGTKWSGNFLNWLAMSRADIVKKVLYGGNRTRDTSSGIGETYLSGEGIPQDGHAWGKEYAGSDIEKLVPTAKSVVNGNRALFCVVHNGANNDAFKLSSNATPIAQLRMLPDMQATVFSPYAARNSNTGLRIWDWVNVEMGSPTSKNICSDAGIDTDGDGSINSVANFPVQKYEVSAKVCDVNVGIEDNCKTYGNNTKPQGLMQQYGEPSSSQKVCSKDMSTACSSNTECTSASNGQCVDNTGMYFGLMAGSYSNPKAGGYLRKNIWGISNETVQSTGVLQTSDPDQKGLIMKSVEALKCPAGTGYYPLSKHWGNPIGEIMYESMRYYGGKVTPTHEYVAGITNTSDAGLYASKPIWDSPSLLYPSCSIPFVLLFSDVYNSFDDDQIPGSDFASFTNADGNLNNFDAKTFANAISANESKTSAIIGVSGTTTGDLTDGMCTSKSINGFGEIEGICPAEADLHGTYYPASAAFYGRTKMKAEEIKPNVLTYVVAFNSNIPEFVLNADGKSVTVIPMAKALADTSSLGWSCNTGNFNFVIDADRGLKITPKTGKSGICPTMAIVTVYVEEHKYDASNKLIYVRFKVASDTLNSDSDYDMDGVAEYTVCAGPSANGCNDASVAADQVRVTVTAQASSAGTNFAHGYVISGTGSTTDGAYLPVRKFKTNDNTPPTACGSLMWGSADLCTLPVTKTQKFTAATNNTGILKNPLWYAAKYGGFNDLDKDGLPFTDSTCSLPLSDSGRNPKCNEWSSKVPGVPDNYFEVSNPGQLEQRLRDALDAIKARVSSGTAASILNNSEGSGASLLQAVFYPQKDFDNNTQANWLGEIHNMWYYIDPYLKLTSIREDTTGDYKLNLKNDRIAQFNFDAGQNKTVVNLFDDANGDGSPDSSTPVETVDPDNVKSLWKAGKKLWERNLGTSPRTIYTNTGIGSLDDSATGLSIFSSAAYTAATAADKIILKSYLQAADDTEAKNIINYIHGYDSSEIGVINSTTAPNYRNRTVTRFNCGVGASDTAACTRTWKLGDIVTSTPKLVTSVNLNQYALSTPIGYGDISYSRFVATSTYRSRGMVFVGGNDGMMHAFKLGILKELTGKYEKAQFTNSSGILATASDDLGREEWSFIPKQTLPYLTYLKDPAYCHVTYVDKTPSIADVSIVKPTATCTATNYWDCVKPSDGSSWRTILIGGTGVGGAAKWNGNQTYTAPTNSVKTPVIGTAASDSLGYSSYFALDVTEPTTPLFKWEFPGTTSALQYLGYSTTGPAIVRISAKIKDSGGNDTASPDHTKNGRWFAVFASGPTGPIDTVKRAFQGQSDQQLRIFIVDMATGALVRTIDKFADNTPLPAEAFGGSLSSSWIDSDRATPANAGWYSDDAIYIGYTRKCTSTETGCDAGTWTKGGVIRVLTKENINPDYWVASPLISNIGPVTTSVSKLQDRKNRNLWIYFGTGRYFFKNDSSTGTMNDQQVIYGVKEPCYTTTNLMNGTCTTSVPSGIVNQSGTALAAPAASLLPTDPGWYVNLDLSNTSNAAERMITDPLASTNGAVFFTTFMPSNDVCKFGGDTYIWALRYDSGGVPFARSMQGKALMQVSTGAFAEISLSDAFKTKNSNKREDGRKLNTPISGVPPTSQGLSLITNPPAVKKILHVREK